MLIFALYLLESIALLVPHHHYTTKKALMKCVKLLYEQEKYGKPKTGVSINHFRVALVIKISEN